MKFVMATASPPIYCSNEMNLPLLHCNKCSSNKLSNNLKYWNHSNMPLCLLSLQLDHPLFLTPNMRVPCRRFSTWRMILVISEPELRKQLLQRNPSLAVHCIMLSICLRVLVSIWKQHWLLLMTLLWKWSGTVMDDLSLRVSILTVIGSAV
jgi:hypothetical protein